MFKNHKFFLGFLVAALTLAGIIFLSPKESKALFCVKKAKDLNKIFPKTVSQIKKQDQVIFAKIDQLLAQILTVPAHERNFENTMQPLDDIKLHVGSWVAILGVLSYLSPDDRLRAQAQLSSIDISNYITEKISLNKQLYLALSNYIEPILMPAQKSDLTQEQLYFLKETLAEFKRSGLSLPDSQLVQVKLLMQDLNELEQQYLNNLAQDQSNLVVSKSDLVGVQQDFVANLKSDGQGNLILNCDDNSYLKTMSSCENSKIREKLYRAYTNRAHPQNELILKAMIAKRDQLAHLLGFTSYAHLDLDNQMVVSPKNAQTFLLDLLPLVQAKAACEINELKKDLPASVVLQNGKIRPCDVIFLKDYYKRKYLNLDDQLISQYFEQSHTIGQLLKIYEQFLDIKFIEQSSSDLWAPTADLKVLAVYQAKNNQLIGYLVLDLFPRANKLPHAGAQISVLPAILGSNCAAVSVILTNFNRPQNHQPALMSYQQVRTFFHEFGHAMHAMLGATQLASQSGINVKMDFVEMPSQMLECWLAEPDILAQISRHYQTGLPLSQDLITKIVQAQNFDTGDQILRQINLSLLALELYADGQTKDFDSLRAKLADQIYDYMIYDPQNKQLSSFMHVATAAYGPKYYGYLWSRVFASDIFGHIKELGLSDSATGCKYITQVIGKGGSYDPNLLLQGFLGRKPSQDAFKKELGF